MVLWVVEENVQGRGQLTVAVNNNCVIIIVIAVTGGVDKEDSGQTQKYDNNGQADLVCVTGHVLR